MSRLLRFGAGSVREIGSLAGELGLERLVLVTTGRGRRRARSIPVLATYDGVRPHVPAQTVAEAAACAESVGADGLVALGGGSAIDTCKAVTVALVERGRHLRTIAVPTTYAGAETTPYFGVRDERSGQKRSRSHGLARPVACVYDPELTLDLPRPETGGTALNALAHCAEALYVRTRNDEADREALAGASLIVGALPAVLAHGRDLAARTTLLEGAMHAALALDGAGLGLGHAMAQALGGRHGLPHGALNAICLPAALRFNEAAVPEALAAFGRAVASDDPAGVVEELARLAGFARLRDLGVPEDELGDVAAATAVRAGAKANPRPATPSEIEELLRSVW